MVLAVRDRRVQQPGQVVFEEFAEAPVPKGKNDHGAHVYGMTVHAASARMDAAGAKASNVQCSARQARQGHASSVLSTVRTTNSRRERSRHCAPHAASWSASMNRQANRT